MKGGKKRIEKRYTADRQTENIREEKTRSKKKQKDK